MAGKKFGTFTSNAFSDVIGSKLSPSSNEVSHRAAFLSLKTVFGAGEKKIVPIWRLYSCQDFGQAAQEIGSQNKKIGLRT